MPNNLVAVLPKYMTVQRNTSNMLLVLDGFGESAYIR